MEHIIFKEEGTRTAVECLDILSKSRACWLYRAKRLNEDERTIMVFASKKMGIEIHVELTNNKTEDGKNLYRFIKVKTSQFNATKLSSEFTIED